MIYNKGNYIDIDLKELKSNYVSKVNGIYFLYKREDIIYIGKSINVIFRIGQHLSDYHKDFDYYKFIEFNEDEDLEKIEKEYIDKYKPFYNIKKNLNREISLNEDFKFPQLIKLKDGI